MFLADEGSRFRTSSSMSQTSTLAEFAITESREEMSHYN
jgi:hypothetical protein